MQTTSKSIKSANPDAILEIFQTDTQPESLSRTFSAIKSHPSFVGLKVTAAIYSIKHAAKKPFLTETHQDFTESLCTYVGGAMAFAQEALKLMFEHHGDHELSTSQPEKKGTIIFTGTLGAMRSNAEYASYGAGRAGARQLAQSLGKEFGVKGIHVVHVIANGGIVDDKNDEAVMVGKRMASESVGKTYAWLIGQSVDLWTDELDMRPAQEKW